MRTERQRDAETDRLLRATLQPGAHAEACPGADMLAAYAEGSLSPTERDSLDVHFADCHRCQEALAFMARAWPTPDTAQPSTSGRWWSLRMRWLVPVAVAAVVVMYVAVRPVIAPNFPSFYQSPETGQSPVPKHVMADARPQEREATTVEPETSGAGRITPPRKSEGATAGRKKEAGTRPQDDTRGADQIARPRVSGSQGTVSAGAVVAPPAAETPKPPATAVNEARPGSPPPAALAAAPAAPRSMAAEAPRQQLALKAAASAPRDVASPDGSAMWHIGPGGRLLRSTDRGTTWQAQPSGVSVELLAGSAPSGTICWIVGREATIIVTTDGARWTTRPFPERVDLVAVEATDAHSATVTTHNGRRFATLDGGTTWTARKE